MTKRTSRKRHSRKRTSRANSKTSGVRVEKIYGEQRAYQVSDGSRRAEVFSIAPGMWVAHMAGKKSHESRTKAAAMKWAKAMVSGTTKNGWGRRASRGLKGKRRARSKRTSRRNTSYDYGSMSHPGSYDSRGRPRRNSRKRRSRKNQTYYIPIPPPSKNSLRKRARRRAR